MAGLFLVVFLLFLESSTAQLTAVDKMEILNWHNQQRGLVNATNMLELVWSTELASLAQTYADQCPSSPTDFSSERNLPSLAPVGENIALFNTSTSSEGYGDLLQSHWVDQASQAPPNCTTINCLQYLQVFWPISRHVGCGVTTDSCGEGRSVIVCNYGMSPVNVALDLSKPPYNIGERCSECPSFAPNCSPSGLCYAVNSINIIQSSTVSPSPSPTEMIQVITVTITQTPGYCTPCDDEFCTSLGRLPSLYLILIGVIPSTLALGLCCLVLVMVCINRRLKKVRKPVHRLGSPNASALASRRMQPKDTAAGPTIVLDNGQNRHLQSPTSSSGTAVPLLPEPPYPFFNEDEEAPVRGNTFSMFGRTVSEQENNFRGYPGVNTHQQSAQGEPRRTSPKESLTNGSSSSQSTKSTAEVTRRPKTTQKPRRPLSAEILTGNPGSSRDVPMRSLSSDTQNSAVVNRRPKTAEKPRRPLSAEIIGYPSSSRDAPRRMTTAGELPRPTREAPRLPPSPDILKYPKPVGLEAINEESEEQRQDAQRGGVASMIARLERRESQVVQTEF